MRKFHRFILLAGIQLLVTVVVISVAGAQSLLPPFVATQPGVVDYIVPGDISMLQMSVAGAQGGNIDYNCTAKGGTGVVLQVNFPVSYCTRPAIVPGGIIRCITGEQGGSVRVQGKFGAGGGGGSAVLYKAPGTTSFIVLVVAGGGGGACLLDFIGELSCRDGLAAQTGTSGGEGKFSIYIGTGGAGGVNGNGGEGYLATSYGGGGAFTNGVTASNQGCSGKAGFPGGGAAANCNDIFTVNGGFGFGSGAAGVMSGGGGGGYSGGGGGFGIFSGGGVGGGGGSFSIPWAINRVDTLKKTGNGEINIVAVSGTLLPAIGLESSILPGISIVACTINTANFSFSYSETPATLDQFIAAGGQITSGGCALKSITYVDTLDPINPTLAVNRTYRLVDEGDNIVYAKQVIRVTNPGATSTISPAAQTVCVNVRPSAINLNISTQLPVTVQWYVGEDPNLSNATLIPGAVSGSYTPPVNAEGVYFYLARIVSCGSITVKRSVVTVASQPTIWYKDADNDNYADPAYGAQSFCTQPGQIYKSTVLGYDCDDNDSTYNPTTIWAKDQDGDGYYFGSPFTGCLPPGSVGFVRKTSQLPGDCNDNNNQIHPGRPEINNGIDDDCDGLIDIFVCPSTLILYVKANATGANNGTSWANAFTSLADALEQARRCPSIIEIWVAAGTYYPDQGRLTVNNDRSLSFKPRRRLSIYGGFRGTEMSFSDRTYSYLFPSILSGDIDQDRDFANNAFHVLVADSLDQTFLMDGFTITEGASNAPTSELNSKGAGLLVNGGNPVFKNLVVRGNTGLYGPGITCVNAKPLFINCVLANNTITSGRGVVWNDNASPSLINCSIAANTNIGVEATVVKNTGNASPTLVNSIIRGAIPSITGGTPIISYSIVEDTMVWPGSGNNNADPLFTGEVSGNLQLKSCSPAINAGTYIASATFDHTGLRRPTLGVFDMGAFEFTADPFVSRLYVKANATGANDGSSWSNAYLKLNDAIDNSKTCAGITEIWVSAGTYFPDEGGGNVNDDRNASFILRNKLAIYGGFTGNEINLSQRNPQVNLTTLSGDIGSIGSAQDNSYSIVFATDVDSTAVLDGFTIANANAFIETGNLNDTRPSNNGGGVYLLSASPVITNCSIRDNNAGANGGGLYNSNGSPSIINCTFSGNRAAWGGAVFNTASSAARLTNCLFYNNRAFSNGGAMLNKSFSNPVLTHCTFATNTALQGEAMANYDSTSAVIRNSIIWTNNAPMYYLGGGAATISNSIVKGGSIGAGNLDANPLFADAAGFNFSLQNCSPAINAAITIPGIAASDILGKPRPAYGLPDMGAYEVQTGLVIPAASILYVNAAATGDGSGRNWSNAVPNLQYALKASCSNTTQIWVAGGTYKPASNNSRDSSFIMRNNLAIYGGFAGNETQLTQRNWRTNATILSGDIGIINNIDDNVFNVVQNVNNGLNNTAILDGFIIEGGNANQGTFVGNRGGAIHNLNSEPSIFNCMLRANNAVEYGGAMFNQGSSPLVFNCVFSGNTALYGGGLYNESAGTKLVNCTFSANVAAVEGGAISSYAGAPQITNCILWGNSSEIRDAGGSVHTVTYSIVGGGYAGTGNGTGNPLFIDQPAPGISKGGDLRLLGCSPAVNAGLNSALPAGTLYDLARATRIVNNTVDMGAYERSALPPSTIIYVDSAATGNNSGESWANAYTKLSSALNELNFCAPGTTVYIAKGTYSASPTASYRFEKLNARIQGGFPAGGGVFNPSLNKTVLKGAIEIVQSVELFGIEVKKL